MRDIKTTLSSINKYRIKRKMDHRFKIGIKGLDHSNIKKRARHLSEEMNLKKEIKIKEIKKGIFKIYI